MMMPIIEMIGLDLVFVSEEAFFVTDETNSRFLSASCSLFTRVFSYDIYTIYYITDWYFRKEVEA